MKLVAWTLGACAAVAVTGLLGCSSTPAVRAPQPASLNDAAGTTQLMSAELPAPAPRVGKSHLDVDADDDSDIIDSSPDKLGAPKAPRRSDGSRRGGHFGTSK